MELSKLYNTNSISFLEDKFLEAITEQKHRDIYARIIALNINEIPLDQIEGKITGGSINIDGNSSVRRTCSLTMVTKDININDYYWSIKTKFRLEIGLCNRLTGEYAPVQGGKYPEIVWFPQGYYVISAFNTSLSTNSCTISIQGKDKMSLLNGDLGGQLYASIDFGTEETKETAMERVVSGLFSSSEEIVSKKYYIKASERDEYLFPKENNPNEISVKNSLYAFVRNQENGDYYKDGNLYKRIDGKNNNQEKDREKLKCYDMYKQVEQPSELFKLALLYRDGYRYTYKLKEAAGATSWCRSGQGHPNQSSYDYFDYLKSYKQITENFSIYKSNFYYYQNIFIKDSSNQWTRKTYYQKENDEYKNIFVPQSSYDSTQDYYCLSGPYILDTASEQTYSDREYYELIPLYQKYDSITKTKLSLNKIIREAVHTYTNEPYHNIIIKDLDDYGLEQLTYRGDIPLYALLTGKDKWFVQLFFKGQNKTLENLIEMNKNSFIFYSLSELKGDGENPTYIRKDNQDSFEILEDINSLDNNDYCIAKFEYGIDVGYRLTNLKYDGDLINSIGESLTSIFDKIKKMLGEFEYFYDLDGRFVFQKKPNYIQNSWSPIVKVEDEEYIDYVGSQQKIAFNFEGNHLISAIQNSPMLNNVKNDFVVWGKRKDSDGEVPIHARYAIDKKPIYYKALSNEIYTTNEEIVDFNVHPVDWREIIYQMALDYFAVQGCSEENPLYLKDDNGEEYMVMQPDHLLHEVGRRNPEYYSSGYTGYEQYYTDMQGFWRQLYNCDYIPEVVYSQGEYKRTEDKNFVWKEPQIIDYNIDYYFSLTSPGVDEQYNELQKLAKAETEEKIYQNLLNKYEKYLIKDGEISKLYWNCNVFEHPEVLNFWIDFFDSGSELGQFSIQEIGDRTCVVNEDKAGAIIYSMVPQFILYTEELEKDNINNFASNPQREELIQSSKKSGYKFIKLPTKLSSLFTISYRNISVKDKIDALLYEHSYCMDNITITSIPIYNLEPNTRIYVYDKNTNIDGEYIVNRITIPLNYNGTMSITANKAPERLYQFNL